MGQHPKAVFICNNFRSRLKSECICSEDKLPSVSSINRIVRSNKHYENTSSPQSSSSLTNYQDLANDIQSSTETSISNKPTKKYGKTAYEKLSKIIKTNKAKKAERIMSDIDFDSITNNQMANDESNYNTKLNDTLEVRANDIQISRRTDSSPFLFLFFQARYK
jgi:hypothetical protein